MKEYITKWYLNKTKHINQDGVWNCDIDGSDVGGEVTAYKTKHGNLAILKLKNNKSAFYSIFGLLSYCSRGKGYFIGNCSNSAIENALKKGRQVYTFTSIKLLFNNHKIMKH